MTGVASKQEKPTPIRNLDTEAVRLPLERELADQLQREPFVASIQGSLALPDPAAVRRKLMGQSLRLSEGMAPELHASAKECLGVLGITRPIEIYQSAGIENASIHFIEEPILVEVQGRMITLLDPGSMRAVLGHELGHYLAHGPWTPLGQSGRMASVLADAEDVPEPIQKLSSSLSMAGELTADRFGLLACQDLHALLRLEMISTTGLPGNALTWDTEAYLAQCKELIEQCLREGSGTLGVTHPEHNLRAYAAWLFSESDLYRSLTGRGPGSRSMADINAVLAKVLAVPGFDTSYHMLEPQPAELHACALASSVLVAAADGEMADAEAEAIERVFAPLVSEYAAYFDVEFARRRFGELAGLMASLGAASHRSLFGLLAHVIGADGVLDPREVSTLLAIGDAIGAGALFQRLAVVLIRRFGLSPDAIPQPVLDVPLPPRAREAQSALDAFLGAMARRGGGEATLRRLLRLLGAKRKGAELLRTVQEAIQRAGLRPAEEIASVELDTVLQLEARSATPPPPTASTSSVVPGSPESVVLRGIGKLREQLVSGDGRSPSIRLYQPRPGRAFDLEMLEQISVGLSERVLAQVRSGERAVLVKAAEAGRHTGANQALRDLLMLDREHKGRLEETGANDLALGYPFLIGLAGGYLVRGPLVLYPVDLERDDRGARSFALRPHKDQPPTANLALLRVLFTKKGLPLQDDLAARLDELAADLAHGPEALLGELSRLGISSSKLTGELSPLKDRREEVLGRREDFLEVEEIAVLGLFPQSNSDLLQDYDGLLTDLARGDTPIGTLLGGALELLPAEMRDRFGSNLTPSPPQTTSEESLGVPVIASDPSQRQVLALARTKRALVVDGPPGTGKSQVIVNLVADAIGRGERVAVVSEKRAALDVVAQRLQQTGFEHAVALVHDVQEDRKPVYQKIAARLEAGQSSDFDTASAAQTTQELAALTQVFDRRAELLGRNLPGCSMRVGQLHALSAGLPAAGVPAASGCMGLRDSELHRARTEIAALRRYADLFGKGSQWRSGRISLAEKAESWFQSFEPTIARAVTTAAELEQGLATVAPTPIERLESAKGMLEAARGTRDLRVHPEDQMLFANALTVATLYPDRARNLGEAEQAWAQAQEVLLQFSQRVAFNPGPTAEAAMGVLLQWGNRFFRYFSPAWWRARGVVRGSVTTLLPEKAGASLDPPLLTELLSRARATRAWEQAEACLEAFSLRSLASNSAAHVGGLLRKVGETYRRLTALVATRHLLEAVHAWPARFSVEEIEAWDRALDARLHVLAARDAHHTAAQSLSGFFPWLGRLPGRAELEAFLEAFRRDARRVAEADRRLTAFSTLCPEAPAVFHAFSEHLPTADASGWSESLVKTWAVARLDALERSTPELRQLDGPTPYGDEEAAEQRMAATVGRAADLERKRIAARLDNHALLRAGTAQRGRRRTADQAMKEAMLKECRKQRNVMPMRTFMRKFAPEGLLDLVPVWLLSPETMTVLFPRQPLFDLVIFDEASQCTVESGLPVLLRAQRSVIAGDEKQMPPTSFFTARSTDEGEISEDEEATGARELFEAESLLTLARSRVPRSGLSWHYRCAHEELIAFSNYAMYDGSLLTIPSTASRTAPPAIRTVMVPDGKYDAGRNEPEARVVMDTVMDLLGRTPVPTIGIVTLNIQQRQTILDEIDRRRASDRVFAERWDQACSAERLDERPFVKNLENVQGDERDIILFSPAYAPVERVTKRGTERVVPARFGPLGQRGGERRLNVAVSRAKRECIIVASFEPGMLSVGRTKNEGPKLFKLFLEFAFHLSSGQRALAERVLRVVRESRPTSALSATTDLPPGYVPLKAQIAMALQQRGVTCELDVGTSDFKVPLAVVDSVQSSRYAVAVLCDEGDETCEAFERHVHRPASLRARDWKVLRVTARDWARNSDAVLARIMKALGVESGASASTSSEGRTAAS
ncbi:AAA domain-containing protein [Polyangium fumosum]|uniref:DUF4011 domain-containing protein n=1 Tax=Polyangium fumosum TaxID=889272 RepID=A0A4U1IJU5_9BACT|nr:AAA domain-containing protein [Polyangium fumosum]TKC94174.1 DUF4011 domain-containing protein [Polyangium fumosum]